MIQLKFKHSLLFCELDIVINNQKIHLNNVLIDTGSATTLINSDYISLDGTEEFINIYGVGGYEAVLNKQFKSISINNIPLKNIVLSVGELDYGINIDMLIGLDLLKLLNADININDMILHIEEVC